MSPRWLVLLSVFIVAAQSKTKGPTLYDVFPSSDESCEVVVVPARILSLFSTLPAPARTQSVQVEITEVTPVQTGCQAANATYEATINLNLKNTGSQTIAVPYTLSLRSPAYLAAFQPFNMVLNNSKPQDGSVVCMLLPASSLMRCWGLPSMYIEY